MLRDTLKKYYIVHSWLGVVTGILMFIICFTGALSVFGNPDLKIWSEPELHRPMPLDPAAIARLVETHGAAVPEEYTHEVRVLLPGPRAYGDFLLLFETEHGADERIMAFTFNPQTLALEQKLEGSPETVFAQESDTLESFLTHFHANLHIGKLGLILTGLLGLTLVASIISGLIIHRKILKELFRFRPFRSVRLMLTDTHKVMSVWGVLFHGMIGFTGAFLGLTTVVLLPLAAFVSFEGDQEKLLATVLPERMPVLSGEPLVDMKLDRVLEHSIASGGITRSMTIMGWGDSNATVYVDTYGGEKMPSQSHSYRLRDGEHLSSSTGFALVGGVSGPILDYMYPLHFGNFGGVAVRALWALLGLSTALIAVTGMMIWVERRAFGAEGKLPKQSYLRLSKFTIGSCCGLVLSCCALFWTQRFAPALIAESFFVVWLLAIGFAALRTNNYRSNRELLGLSGLLLATAPMADAFLFDYHLFNSFAGTHNHFAAIELSLLACGMGMFALAMKLPSERPQPEHKNAKSSKDADESELEIAIPATMNMEQS